MTCQNLIDYRAQWKCSYIRTTLQRAPCGSKYTKIKHDPKSRFWKKNCPKIERFKENVLVNFFFRCRWKSSSERLSPELSDSYEDVNIARRRELGDDYDVQCPDYVTTMQQADSWLKDGRSETRNRKQGMIWSGLAKLRFEEFCFS